MKKFCLFCVALVSVLILTFSPAHADPQAPDDTGRFTATEENDYFVSKDDRHYTQGARISYLSGAVTPGNDWDAPYRWLDGNLPVVFESGPSVKRKYDVMLGQSLFTPKNLVAATAPKIDRPYAGWLYTGAELLQDSDEGSHHTLENLEADIGVVGPAAFGSFTQNDYHQFIGVNPAAGWHNQLHNEPGLVLSYEKKWRFGTPVLGDGYGIDVIPEAGATGGNIFTYAETSGLVRFGKNLNADYGPTHIRPSLSGTDWFDKNQMKGDLGWYFFAGLQGRAVARNIFLDGNTFESSPSVNKRPLVGDFVGGASLFWTDAVRIDFTYIERTKEFYGQAGTDDKYGGINLAFRL